MKATRNGAETSAQRHNLCDIRPSFQKTSRRKLTTPFFSHWRSASSSIMHGSLKGEVMYGKKTRSRLCTAGADGRDGGGSGRPGGPAGGLDGDGRRQPENGAVFRDRLERRHGAEFQPSRRLATLRNDALHAHDRLRRQVLERADYAPAGF